MKRYAVNRLQLFRLMTTVKTSKGLRELIDEKFTEFVRHAIVLKRTKLDESNDEREKDDEKKLLLGDVDVVEGDSKEDSKTMASGDVTSDDIVEKLNTIRSGKSFKDAAIKSSLDKYIGELSTAEKTAMFTFLKGLAQIVTGEVEPEAAVEPSDDPAKVKMEKKPSAGKRVVVKKPVVVKNKPSAPRAEKSSVEDTSAPEPITPKKR